MTKYDWLSRSFAEETGLCCVYTSTKSSCPSIARLENVWAFSTRRSERNFDDFNMRVSLFNYLASIQANAEILDEILNNYKKQTDLKIWVYQTENALAKQKALK